MKNVPEALAEEHSPVIVLLAAGESRRFGGIKQLALIEGQPMLRHAARAALATGVPVLVVTGAHAPEVEQALGGLGIHLKRHSEWALGMGSSLAAGIGRVATHFAQASAALVCLADQPMVGEATLNAMLARHRRMPDRVLATQHGSEPGVPALFPRACFPALLALSGAEGARGLLRQMGSSVVLLDHDAGPDVDTPADLQSVLAWLSTQR